MIEMGLVVTDKKTLWQERMATWEKSGLTQSAFCAQHNITMACFGYWRTRLKKLSLAVDKNEGQVNFFPVKVSSNQSSSLMLKMNDQFSIEVQPGFNRDLLVELMQALQSVR